jgi:hypothetical protein
MSEEHVNRIRDPNARSPLKSLSRGSRELSVPRTTTTTESSAQMIGYESVQASDTAFEVWD